MRLPLAQPVLSLAVFAVIYRKLTATADSFAAEILESRQMTEQKTARWQSVAGDKAKIV
jgi:hypothetical protein